MKSILTLILFSSLFVFTCNPVPPIVDDICEITSEICYYANLVCDNLSSKESKFNNASNSINQISGIRDELKFINSNLNNSENKFTSDEIATYKKRLYELKIEMIKLYEQTKSD